jgi:hypothetical protein
MGVLILVLLKGNLDACLGRDVFDQGGKLGKPTV